MNSDFRVMPNEKTGTPYLRLAGEYMWDLLEFLSWQRVRTAYGYDATHFTVYFLHTDCASAQRLVDTWAEAERKRPAAPYPYRQALVGLHAR